MYQRILVPTDGSACSDEAIAARRHCRQRHAIGRRLPLRHGHVENLPRRRRDHGSSTGDADRPREGDLDRAEKVAASVGALAGVELVEGTPADVIVRRTGDFDLVVDG